MSSQQQTLSKHIRERGLKLVQNQLYSIAADKYRVREHVRSLDSNIILPELYLVTQDPREIKLDKLPSSFVLKGNHGCGPDFMSVVRNGIDVLRNTVVTENSIQRLAETILKKKYAFKMERHYRYIEPVIIIEQYLGIDDKFPDDYKFHVIRNKVCFIHVDVDRHTSHKRNVYWPDWTETGFELGRKNGCPVPKPSRLEQMICIAENLSKGFNDYVRIDLYLVDNNIYFGEIIVTPAAGHIGFRPYSWDIYFGKLLKR